MCVVKGRPGHIKGHFRLLQAASQCTQGILCFLVMLVIERHMVTWLLPRVYWLLVKGVEV